MKRNLVWRAALSCFLTCVIATIAWTHPQAKADKISRGEALGLVRTINNVEAEIFAQKHQYIPLDAALRDRRFQEHPDLAAVTLKDAHSGTIKDYSEAVIPSADGQHYVIELFPSSGCGPALFSNESGVIYEATPLGCPAQKFPEADTGN